MWCSGRLPAEPACGVPGISCLLDGQGQLAEGVGNGRGEHHSGMHVGAQVYLFAPRNLRSQLHRADRPIPICLPGKTYSGPVVDHAPQAQAWPL